MQIRSIVVSCFVPFVVIGCAVAPATSRASSPPVASVKPDDHARPNPGHVYRLDFVVASSDPATQTGGTGAGAFTMTLEEGHSGEIRSGSNVALTPNGQARVDVGTKLKASYFTVGAGDDLLLESEAELSSADEPGVIHKLTARGGALVSPGKQALVASAEDPHGHTRYQLTVTATKLR